MMALPRLTIWLALSRKNEIRKMTDASYRRYTNLASLLDTLRNHRLTLLSPESWDDRNDAFFMAEYKRLKKLKTLLALCLAVREETYHHWQVFSHGADGVCIEFDEAKLTTAFNAVDVRHGLITYELLKNVQRMDDVDPEQLPFMKRWPYGDEREYRVVFTDELAERASFHVPIQLDAIRRITLSPWLHPALVPALRDTIKELKGCAGLSVHRSTLIDNDQWKKLTGRVSLPVVPPT